MNTEFITNLTRANHQHDALDYCPGRGIYDQKIPEFQKKVQSALIEPPLNGNRVFLEESTALSIHSGRD